MGALVQATCVGDMGPLCSLYQLPWHFHPRTKAWSGEKKCKGLSIPR